MWCTTRQSQAQHRVPAMRVLLQPSHPTKPKRRPAPCDAPCCCLPSPTPCRSPALSQRSISRTYRNRHQVLQIQKQCVIHCPSEYTSGTSNLIGEHFCVNVPLNTRRTAKGAYGHTCSGCRATAEGANLLGVIAEGPGDDMLLLPV
jgi:hypothetical protein